MLPTVRKVVQQALGVRTNKLKQVSSERRSTRGEDQTAVRLSTRIVFAGEHKISNRMPTTGMAGTTFTSKTIDSAVDHRWRYYACCMTIAVHIAVAYNTFSEARADYVHAWRF